MLQDKRVSTFRHEEFDPVLFATEVDESEWIFPHAPEISLSNTETLTSTRGAPRLSGADIQGADLSDSQLVLGDFAEAHARGARFTGSDLTFADFHQADLREADLSHACLCLADLRDCDLRGADLTGADLMRAELLGSDLRGARLAGACLHNAELVGAKFDEKTELPIPYEQALAEGMVFETSLEVHQ